MANMHLVTGRAGEKHVSAADEGALNAAVFGSGQYVLNEGGNMAATVVSNNAVRIADGAAMFHGRYIRLEGYEDLTIETGTQGTYRNDLIVIRYTKDTTANTESARLVVIKGTANGTKASDPAHVSGNILEGAVQADMPLYRIPLDNVNIGTPVALFEMMEANVGTLDGKQDATKNLTATTTLADGDYFPFYDVSVSANRKTLWSNVIAKIKTAIWGTTSGFVKANGSGGISGVSTIPIANGGTGATTATAARTALGLGSVATMSTVPFANGGTNATNKRTAAFNLIYLGESPVTLDTDTPNTWSSLGLGYAYINKAGVIKGQPTTYGFVKNYVCGDLVVQSWQQLSSSGRTFHRAGTGEAWYSDDWVEDFNTKNLNPATLDGNSKVKASQAQSYIKMISESAYTLVAEDAGKMLRAGNCTITIPVDADCTLFPIGTEIEINVHTTTHAITIKSANATSLNFLTNNGVVSSVTTEGNFAVVVLKRTSATYWLIKGEIA